MNQQIDYSTLEAQMIADGIAVRDAVKSFETKAALGKLYLRKRAIDISQINHN